MPAICRWKNKNSLLELFIPLALSIVCILLSMLATDLISLTLCTVYLCNPYNDSEICSFEEKEISFFMLDMDRFTIIIVLYLFFLRLACFQGGEQLDICTAANQFVLDSKKALAYVAIIDKDYTICRINCGALESVSYGVHIYYCNNICNYFYSTRITWTCSQLDEVQTPTLT